MNDSPKKKLLLIDDEPSDHTLLRMVLELPPPIRPPVELFGAMSFEGGFRMVQEVVPDVVLLDLKLSETMRGMATIEAMKTYLVPIVPVLILTGNMEPSDDWTIGQLWKEARIAGACGFLRKDRYLDPKNREFLLHELHDAMLEFSSRPPLSLIPRVPATPLPPCDAPSPPK